MVFWYSAIYFTENLGNKGWQLVKEAELSKDKLHSLLRLMKILNSIQGFGGKINLALIYYHLFQIFQVWTNNLSLTCERFEAVEVNSMEDDSCLQERQSLSNRQHSRPQPWIKYRIRWLKSYQLKLSFQNLATILILFDCIWHIIVKYLKIKGLEEWETSTGEACFACHRKKKSTFWTCFTIMFEIVIFIEVHRNWENAEFIPVTTSPKDQRAAPHYPH